MALAILGLYAGIIEPEMIKVSRIEIDETGADMRVGLVADFQRRSADPAFVQRAVDILNSEDLDLVLIAGDFVDETAEELPSIDALRGIRAEYGTYGVLGNHDYAVYSHARGAPDKILAEDIIGYVEEGGAVRILRNEAVRAGGVEIVGLDSYWAGLRDETVAPAGPRDVFRILISHNQDDLEISGDVADLYLFGHTHCGQIRLPLIGSVAKLAGHRGEYDYGHYDVSGVDVYTTCGLSPWPRFLNPPEVTILSLS